MEPENSALRPAEETDVRVSAEVRGRALEMSDTAKDRPNWHGLDPVVLLELFHQSQDALIVRDFLGTVHDMNPAAEALYGYSVEEARGKTVTELFRNRIVVGFPAYVAALLRDGAWSGEIIQRRRDGSEIIVSSRQTLRRGAEGEPELLLASNRDITEQFRATRRLQKVFDSRVVGITFWDLDSGLVKDANDTFLAMVGYSREDLQAGSLNVFAMTPPEWQKQNAEVIATARLEGATPPFEKEYLRKDGSRVPVLVGGARFDDSPSEGFSFILDITEQKQQEARERARDARERTRLNEIFQRVPAFVALLRGPQHVCEIANQPYFELVARRDVIERPTAEALPETVDQGLIDRLDQVYETGEAFVGNNMPILLQSADGSGLAERYLDFIYQPLFNDQGRVYGILVHGVDQTARRRLEIETELLREEQRRHSEREALWNKIRAAVRSTSDPEGILREAVAALGQGLSADRCYFVRYNQTRDSGLVHPEWLREGAPLKPMAGVSRLMSAYSVNRDPVFRAGETQVIHDIAAYSPENAAPLLALQIQSLVRVPIEVGDQMTALGVAQCAPRTWSAEDLHLIENVALLIRSALESAYVQQREHNIAQQLQEALQPSAPSGFPGLALASHYSAALGEAEVGGDFHDAFELDNGRYGLVVGDLAGKGLTAASQVALVRNQLRYALYTAELTRNGALAKAVETLNRVLASRSLLAGFATLFAGVWDAGAGTLTYVNAGQEASLIWRKATGLVELLPPTGPVLGAFEGASFDQRTESLAVGDIWMAFSDGMTETGPSREELLGIDGAVPLFGQTCTACAAESGPDPVDPIQVLNRLVDSIRSYSSAAVTRDDLCALVGVRQAA